jgi:hypothetical protein
MKKNNQTDFITDGTLHSVHTYRTKDGLHFYQFDYVYVPQGYYEIDIISQPSYGNRSDNIAITHRFTSSRSGRKHKVCISDDVKSSITLQKAKNISMEWAELTTKYIHTGVTLDKQIAAYSN